MNSPIDIQPANGGLPIKMFLSPEMMPDLETIAQLERLSGTEGLAHHVAVLPDVHRKSRNLSPTGTVVASRNAIVPRAVDTGINCGMRMVRTDIDLREFTAPVLDRLFAELKATIPVYLHQEDTLRDEDVYDILVQGGEWSRKRFGLDDVEMSCIEDRGAMPTDAKSAEEIIATMPRKSIKKGRKVLGTLGDGNHFLELQEIVEVLDEEIARALGLHKGKAFFMLHTGSRAVGSKMMKGFLREYEEKHFPNGDQGSPIWTLQIDSDDGLKYAYAVSAASNFGFANRIAITEMLRQAVQKVLADSMLCMPLLYDCAHVSIKKEQWNGEHVWIHRHGASRALPAAQYAEHPIFCKTGQPVPIPGSMGHSSYVGVADVRAEQAFFSVNHGAGRVMDKPEASSTFSERQVETEMAEKNIRLYRYNSDNIAEQAPGSFKDISQVIETMSDLALAKPVVKLRPVAVLKG
ncbi:MAG: RtcB family protein [bacterium]